MMSLASACTAHRSVPATADASIVSRERALSDSAASALGVPPFRVALANAGFSALGFALADLLTSDLSRSAQLTVVERARLGDVLNELDLARAGRVDSATAPRVGKLIGARRLVLGALDTLPGGDVRMAVRIADVASGQIESSLDARAPLTDMLQAEKALVFRIFDALNIVLTPAERAEIESRRTSSVAALAAYGRGVQAEQAREFRRAFEEYQRSSTIDPDFRPPVERIEAIRADAQTDDATPTMLPNRRRIGASVNGTVDRVNRPLDLFTTFTRPQGGPGDPAFPNTIATVLLTVKRP